MRSTWWTRNLRGVLVGVLLAFSFVLLWVEKNNTTFSREIREWTLTGLSPLLRATAWVANCAQEASDWVGDKSRLESENDALRQEVAEARAQNQLLVESLKKAQRLNEEPTEALAESNANFVVADLVARNAQSWGRTLLINKGSRDGLVANLPVVSADGLVGTLRQVSDHNSVVQLVTDPQSAVSGLIPESRDRGIVRGSGSARALEFQLEQPRVDFEPGQRVVTSGLNGSLFPKGLILGTVEEIKMNKYGQPCATLSPAVNFAQLEEVLVLLPEDRVASGKE